MHRSVPESDNFIYEIVEDGWRNIGDKGAREVVTRFPPEPSGYLHIGHAKAIVLNFDLAAHYRGVCYLRYDDTNPERENAEFIRSIAEDVRWLGYRWTGVERYASDYFAQLYQYAQQLIRTGHAYVDHQSPEEIREQRGTPTAAGVESPYRGRSVEENLRDFEKMRNGEYPDGACVLRAKIDMSHPNLNMRDPTMYRIRHRPPHPRTGDEWSIYPLYDYAHGQSDAIEGVTHSLCTLEFENHRPLYDWFIDAIGFKRRPQQIEFARLNISGTVLSKRHLHRLVSAKVVTGWDDPRLMTISGMRRRGYPSTAVRAFCRDIGVTKVESMLDFAHLEHFVRDELNASAPRVMVVLEPIRVIIENYPEERTEEMITAIDNPEDPASPTRQLPFARELYIEASDFMEEPPRKYFRLSPGSEARLKHAYYITCVRAEYDSAGHLTQLICRYDPESAGGTTPDKRKVRGTLHWVSVAAAVPITLHHYQPLFRVADVAEEVRRGTDLLELINPESHTCVTRAMAEPSLATPAPQVSYQFIRHGYYVYDQQTAAFNRTVTLRDSWKKIQAAQR